MKAHGIRRALAALVAYAVSALTIRVPRTPAVIKFNQHAFAKRTYGKVVAGGGGLGDTIRSVLRSVVGTAQAIGAVLRPAAAIAAMLAVMLAIDAFTDTSMALATGVVVTSRNLRAEKASLLQQARSAIDDSENALKAVDEKEGATEQDREAAKAQAERHRNIAKTFQLQASELDPRIQALEEQETAEAEMGRSQGRLAGAPDVDPGDRGNERGAAAQINAEIEAMNANDRTEAAGRYILALSAAKGDLGRAQEYASRRFGEDDIAYRALSVSNVDEGGALVPEPLSASVIELLRPMSAIRRLNPVMVPLVNGKLSLPKVTAGAVAQYIGENENAPKTQGSFGNVHLVFKKLAALVPISNDLIRHAPRSLEPMLRDDLSAGLATASDPKFIRGDGSQYAPKGLRSWAPAANVLTANGTVSLTNVTTDLGRLVLALEEADVRMIRPGWIFAPRTKHYLMTVRDGNGNFAFRDEMLGGTLWGWPFSTTTNVPKNLGGGADESEVYLADFADVVLGEAPNIGITASADAAYDDGGTVKAAFSLDQTVLRAIQEHDLVMRHDESVAVLTAVTWGS